MTDDVRDVLSGDREYAFRVGDCLEGLRTLPDGCVSCVVTSPPYFALRDYQTATWEGGDLACKHLKHDDLVGQFSASTGLDGLGSTQVEGAAMAKYGYRGTCRKCGAVRVDRQIGLEETPACGISTAGMMQLRDDLTAQERETVILELVRLGVLG